MKKAVFILIALCLMAGFAFAEEAVTTTPTQTESITGTLIDNMCAGTHKKDLPEFIKTHTKTCALMPDCVASGYSIYAGGKLLKFDKNSDLKVEDFLKKDSNKLEAMVEVERVGNELKILSIRNKD